MHNQRVPTIDTLYTAIFRADNHITRAEHVADTLNLLATCNENADEVQSNAIFLLSNLLREACQDLREVLGSERVCELHPLDVLKKDFMEPQSIDMETMAKDLGLSPRRFREMCKRRRELPKSVLIKLANRFDTAPEYWTELQQGYRVHGMRNGRDRRQRLRRKTPVRRTIHD